MNSNPKEWIDSLYTSFLARDFFAKVVPGSIVLTAVFASPENSGFKLAALRELNVLEWCLLYGVCFFVGFAVQAIGERFKVIRSFPSDETEDAFRVRMVAFQTRNLPQAMQVQRERYVVIKEMTGNVGVALLVSVIAFVLLRISPAYSLHIQVGLTLILACVMWWYHVLHQNRQRDLEERAIASPSIPNLMSESKPKKM